ncbi:MAG: (2Fe-2S)-binding protein, partial [Acidimicrobiia bacterium]
MSEVTVTVNGRPYTRQVPDRLLLSDFLRDELGLTGTHVGCEHGYCGACTVIIDEAPARSCLVLAVQVAGARVETVESLAGDGDLHPIQEAFWNHHGLQCGFCTPGMLMAVKTLLQEDPEPEEASIREYLAGNLCRCTGYVQIVEAVQAAS